MESTKTKELRSRKFSVKSKLMAAVAMLLVSTIMLSSTTYAWFVLSTAPEVKGMSTTVGANGSLEIALLNDSTDTDAIGSGIGTSQAATSDATVSNITWGNIVDLSGTAYGLNEMKLYPAAVNLADATKLDNLYSILKYPSYGADGRVAELSANTMAGKRIEGLFRGDPSYLGVRVIGTGTTADPKAYAFNSAKNNFSENMAAAKSAALTSLNTYGPQLTNLAMKHGLNESATYTAAEVAAITNAVSGLSTAADSLKLAIQYAYEAYRLSNGETPADDLTAVTMGTISGAWTGMATYVAAYNELATAIGTTSVPNQESYTWDEIKPALNALIDTDGMTVSGHTIAEVSAAASEVKNATQEHPASQDAIDLINGLQQSPVVAVKDGLYTKVANFVGSYTSNAFALSLNYNGLPVNIAGATMKIEMANGVAEAYQVPMTNLLTALPAPSGEATALINNQYGYIVDLAVRSNATTDLLLSAPTQRVTGAEETQGYGSMFYIPADTAQADVNKIAKALRVVFIQNTTGNYAILGVAGLASTTGTENVTPVATAAGSSAYALHMYDYSTVANGGIQLNTQKEKDLVASLTADQARCVSVLVYLDGNYVDYAMNEVRGTLNLQFASSVPLNPMNYSNFAPIGGTPAAPANPLVISGSSALEITAEAASPTTQLTVKYNDQDITGTVTWSTDAAGVATVEGTSGTATVTAVAEGTATITAKYTPDGGSEQTATYTITVTDTRAGG